MASFFHAYGPEGVNSKYCLIVFDDKKEAFIPLTEFYHDQFNRISDADIPLIAMSVNPSLTPAEQYAIGKALAPLREQDVLVIGSGVIVHNFGLFRVKDKSAVKSLF